MSLSAEDSYIKKFNTNLIQLIEQLHQIEPTKNLLELNNLIETAIKVNAKLPCNFFLKYCENAIEPIMKVDYEFLKDLNVVKLGNPNASQNANKSDYIKFVEKIIEIWANTEKEEVRSLITKYIHLLLTYSIIINKRQDLVDIMNKYRTKPLVL